MPMVMQFDNLMPPNYQNDQPVTSIVNMNRIIQTAAGNARSAHESARLQSPPASGTLSAKEGAMQETLSQNPQYQRALERMRKIEMA
jgi:hypothetical protein